jgi:hypothetical protein
MNTSYDELKFEREFYIANERTYFKKKNQKKPLKDTIFFEGVLKIRGYFMDENRICEGWVVSCSAVNKDFVAETRYMFFLLVFITSIIHNNS